MSVYPLYVMKGKNLMADDKKKSIFDKAIDALTDRDEKAAAAEKAAAEKSAAAAAEAKKKAEELKAAAEKRAAEAKAATQAKAAADKAAADKAAAAQDAAKKVIADRVAAEKAAAAKAAAEKAAADAKAAAEAAAAEAAKKAVMAEYTVVAGDTLSALALRYYGNAGQAYWKLIYEANKDIIGSNPGMVRTGLTLKIPTLPEEMK